MTLDEFSQYLTWALYVVIFAVSLARAVRHPLSANVDIAILFGIATAVIALSVLVALGLLQQGPLTNAFSTSLLLAMMYMLLRLVYDFSYAPTSLMRLAEVSLAILVVGTVVLSPPRPGWFTTLLLAYVVAALIFSTVAFVRESRRASGVTRRRMRAVAVGSISLCVLFVFAGLVLVLPGLGSLVRPVTDITALVSGVSYFLGFATPNVLRRAWQEPELRAFLGRAARLPRLPDTKAIVREMERGTTISLGARNANIGIWDAGAGVLRFSGRDRQAALEPSDKTTSGRAFLEQRPVFTPEIKPDNPMYAEAKRTYDVRAVMAAPITAGDKKLGVLTVYAPRAPVFADEDLELV
jgi:hypothetical protein